MAFDVLVRGIFSDQGLSVGLAKANAALADLGRAGPGARQGLRAVEQGARALAFEAVGLQGGLGKVAQGLLMFGGGSALVLGAAAGLGAVGLAYRALTRETREAKEEQDKFVKGLASIGPNAAALTERMKLADLQAQLTAERLRTAQASMGLSTESTETERLRREIAAQQNVVADAIERAADATERRADAVREERLHLVQSHQLVQGIANASREIAANIGPTGRATLFFSQPRGQPGGLGAFFSEDALQATRESARLEGLRSTGASVRGLGPFQLALQEMEQGGALRRRPTIDPALALMLAQNLALGAKAGGAGGLLSAGGNAMLALSTTMPGLQIPGLITAGLGTVFSLFDRSEERRHQELIRTIRDTLRPLAFPELISITTVGVDGSRTIDRANRDTRRDAINRTASRS